MQKVRIGIIGAGGIVRQRHLPGLQKVSEVEVAVACNRTRSTAEQVAKDYSIPKVCTDWREVIDMKDIDAVLVGAPPYLHATATIAALDSGKHVFCQARMARNYAEAKMMYQKSLEKKELVTMICPPPHAMKGDYFIQKLLSDGFIGELRTIPVTAFSSAYADPHTPLHWRQDAELSGYNTMNLGMLAEVIHRWCGYFKRLTALAKVHTPLRKRPNSVEWAEVKIADTIGIVAENSNGAVAVFHFSGAALFPGQDRIEMHGTNGKLVYNLATDEIWGAQKGDKKLRAISIPDELIREWKAEADFIDAIRNGKKVSPSFYEGLKYMEFTEAVYKSAASGKAIELPFE